MGKKKINLQGVFVVFFLLLHLYHYSQDMFTKKLEWDINDSMSPAFFQNTDQINDWGKESSPFAFVRSNTICVSGREVYILRVDHCSGIRCLSIYVFVKRNGQWQMMASSNARLIEQLNIEADNNQNKLIFTTKSGEIGELPFDMFE